MAEQLPGIPEISAISAPMSNVAPVADPQDVRQMDQLMQLGGALSKAAYKMQKDDVDQAIQEGFEWRKQAQSDWKNIVKKNPNATNPFWFDGVMMADSQILAHEALNQALEEWASIPITDERKRNPDGFRNILARHRTSAFARLPDSPLARLEFSDSMESISSEVSTRLGLEGISNQITHTINQNVNLVGSAILGAEGYTKLIIQQAQVTGAGITPADMEKLQAEMFDINVETIQKSIQRSLDTMHDHGIPMDQAQDQVADKIIEALKDWSLAPNVHLALRQAYRQVESGSDLLSHVSSIENKYADAQPEIDRNFGAITKSMHSAQQGQRIDATAMQAMGGVDINIKEWSDAEALATGESAAKIITGLDSSIMNNMITIGNTMISNGEDEAAVIAYYSNTIQNVVNAPSWRGSHKNALIEAELKRIYRKFARAHEKGLLNNILKYDESKGYGRGTQEYAEALFFQGAVQAVSGGMGEHDYLNNLVNKEGGVGNFLQQLSTRAKQNISSSGVFDTSNEIIQVFQDDLELSNTEDGKLVLSRGFGRGGVGRGVERMDIDELLENFGQNNENWGIVQWVQDVVGWTDEIDEIHPNLRAKLMEAFKNMWAVAAREPGNTDEIQDRVNTAVSEQMLYTPAFAMNNTGQFGGMLKSHPLWYDQKSGIPHTHVFERFGEWMAHSAFPFNRELSMAVQREMNRGHTREDAIASVMGDALTNISIPYSEWSPEDTPDTVQLWVGGDGIGQWLSRDVNGNTITNTIPKEVMAMHFENYTKQYGSFVGDTHDLLELGTVEAIETEKDRQTTETGGDGDHKIKRMPALNRHGNKLKGSYERRLPGLGTMISKGQRLLFGEEGQHKLEKLGLSPGIEGINITYPAERTIDGRTYRTGRPISGEVRDAYGKNGKINPALSDLLRQLGRTEQSYSGVYGDISSETMHGDGHYKFYIHEGSDEDPAHGPVISFSFQGSRTRRNRSGAPETPSYYVTKQHTAAPPSEYPAAFREMTQEEVTTMFKKAGFDPTEYHILPEDMGVAAPVMTPGELRSMQLFFLHDTPDVVSPIDVGEEKLTRAELADSALRNENTEVFDVPQPRTPEEFWGAGIERKVRTNGFKSLDMWYNNTLLLSDYNPYTGKKFIFAGKSKVAKMRPFGAETASDWREIVEARSAYLEMESWRGYHEDLKPYLEEAIHDYISEVGLDALPKVHIDYRAAVLSPLSPDRIVVEQNFLSQLLTDNQHAQVLRGLIKKAQKKMNKGARVLLPTERYSRGIAQPNYGRPATPPVAEAPAPDVTAPAPAPAPVAEAPAPDVGEPEESGKMWWELEFSPEVEDIITGALRTREWAMARLEGAMSKESVAARRRLNLKISAMQQKFEKELRIFVWRQEDAPVTQEMIDKFVSDYGKEAPTLPPDVDRMLLPFELQGRRRVHKEAVVDEDLPEEEQMKQRKAEVDKFIKALHAYAAKIIGEGRTVTKKMLSKFSDEYDEHGFEF